jgi:hypothetical protein
MRQKDAVNHSRVPFVQTTERGAVAIANRGDKLSVFGNFPHGHPWRHRSFSN